MEKFILRFLICSNLIFANHNVSHWPKVMTNYYLKIMLDPVYPYILYKRGSSLLVRVIHSIWRIQHWANSYLIVISHSGGQGHANPYRWMGRWVGLLPFIFLFIPIWPLTSTDVLSLTEKLISQLHQCPLIWLSYIYFQVLIFFYLRSTSRTKIF